MTRLALALGLAAALNFPALATQIQTLKLAIPQMTACPSCPYIVKSVLSRVEGVSEVETVYETGIATIVYDADKATIEEFVRALADYGYDPEQITPEG